jgi:hypothetical protein
LFPPAEVWRKGVPVIIFFYKTTWQVLNQRKAKDMNEVFVLAVDRCVKLTF